MKSLKVVPFYYIALSKLGYVLKCGLSSTWTFWTSNNCFVKNFTGWHTDYNLEKATCVRLSAALLIVIQLCMVGKPDRKVKMTNLTSPRQMLELSKAQGIKSYDTLLVQHCYHSTGNIRIFTLATISSWRHIHLAVKQGKMFLQGYTWFSRNSFHVKVSVALLSDVKWRAVTFSGTAWST